jgi:hypothetical protein
MSGSLFSDNEIEVTSAMIDAGVTRLEQLLESSSARLVAEVYRAMEGARLHPDRRAPEMPEKF